MRSNSRGLAEYFWPAADARGNVLLQHGFAEYAQRYENYYAKFVGRLNAAGFDVHAFDLPGHGHSPGERRAVDIAEATQAHLEARQQISQDKPLILFGHSLGGGITAASVTKDPTGIAGVVLSGPALIRLPSPLANGLARLGQRYPSLPLKNLAPKGMTRSQEILQAVDADPLMSRGKMPLGVIGSLCSCNQATWQNVGNWTVPTLLVHGSKDIYTNPNDSKRFYQAIHSSDKTLRIIDGAYHETLNDPGGDATAEEIVEWMKDHV